MKVNIHTRPAKKSSIPEFDAGHLQAELLDGEGKPIASFTREDCASLKGDHTDLAVTWKGGNRAPAGAAQAKFYLKRTLLYGFEFTA